MDSLIVISIAFSTGYFTCHFISGLGIRKQLKDAVEYGFKAGAEAANDKWKTELRKAMELKND